MKALIKLFEKPTPVAMAAIELVDAQRSKLEAETARDYATSVVAYNNARIGRLEAYLKGVL